MKYAGRAFGQDTGLSIEKEGLQIGKVFLDYADFLRFRPINHRIFIDLLGNKTVEISMLGFSYDGFLEELTRCFSDRSMEALFAEEEALMRVEGDYQLPGEQGRGEIILLPDAVCILPMTAHAVRIPLCFARELRLEGYVLQIPMLSGRHYAVARMGYETKPFAERAQQAMALTKKKRAQAIAQLSPAPPFTRPGLFRTETPELYWTAALGKGCCAVELFTGDDAATYLYRYTEPAEVFLRNLDEAMEAVGVHREIIFLPADKLNEKPLYRMAAARSEAVRYLRSKSAGRLIHNSTHTEKLKEFLNS